MSRSPRSLFFLAIAVATGVAFAIATATITLPTAPASAQSEVVDPASKGLPNPYPVVTKDWAKLPDGRTWGATAGIDIGPDGHVWAYDRCGDMGLSGGCTVSPLQPILKFDRSNAKLLASIGAGLFALPHGLHVDRVGNVWVTDSSANEQHTKGHQVIKLSPTGEVLLRLGTAGVAGDGPDHFNEPCDVITAPNGDIFVADGHSGQGDNPPPGSTGRIVKFTKNGKYSKEWGRIGTAPGEFRTPHALAFDSKGRLFVADRGNHRIQIFDQEGKYLDSYHQFGRVSGLFITADDTLYAIDSESSPTRHPGWNTGVRIGRAGKDEVTAFIPPHPSDRGPHGTAGEGVAVDADGNVYAAEGPFSRPAAEGGVTRYSKR